MTPHGRSSDAFRTRSAMPIRPASAPSAAAAQLGPHAGPGAARGCRRSRSMKPGGEADAAADRRSSPGRASVCKERSAAAPAAPTTAATQVARPALACRAAATPPRRWRRRRGRGAARAAPEATSSEPDAFRTGVVDERHGRYARPDPRGRRSSRPPLTTPPPMPVETVTKTRSRPRPAPKPIFAPGGRLGVVGGRDRHAERAAAAQSTSGKSGSTGRIAGLSGRPAPVRARVR